MKALIETIRFKNDRYTKARGTPALLVICCSDCQNEVLCYQKDGPGPLKRCYLDRIYYPENIVQLQQQVFDKRSCPNISCPRCGQLIGTPMIYEKEDRPAFRIVQGSVSLKKVK